jgi:NAD-dependent dihydropyrimidine dehydrogenase PreA subunit
VNKFFVPKDIYEDRMAICKSCTYYSSLLGNCGICKCFMKVKSSISSQSCPKGYWQKTTEVEVREDIPEEIIAEIVLLWEDLKTGRAKDQTAKKKMIEIYNTLYGSNYSTGTNCGSCIAACFDGIKKIYKEYSGNN